MKEGLVSENGSLIYYKNGSPYHAGVIKVDGAVYYISSGGRAVKGEHIVHGSMCNDILKKGTYRFGDDYKLIEGSYRAPKKKRKHKIFKTKSKSSSKSKKNIKLKKSTVGLVATIFAIAVALSVIPKLESSFYSAPASEPISQSEVAQESKIILPSFDEEVLICSKAAKMEYDGEISLKLALEGGEPYRAVPFRYTLEDDSGTLLLSESPKLENAKVYVLPKDDEVVFLENLKSNTTYYYKVLISHDEYLGQFKTAASTRFVSIPGLVNTRDIGGATTLDGKTVQQGLLIRGVELDGLVNASFFIPKEELDAVQEEFKFKFDLDLRSPTIYNGSYTSRLDIPHAFFDSPQYGQIFTTQYRNSLKNIFSALANSENYPMYFHCTWGTDRTGTIVFLLQGLLNMSEEDMVREYRLTSYFNSSLVESNNMDVIISGLEPYAGDTLQEKIESFLIYDIGVTEEEIASIRSIFLTE